MRRVNARVPLETCIERAHASLSTMMPLPASSVAEAIWPDTEWRAAQGAGAAASRVLKAMEKRGLARWIAVNGRHKWGWIRTGSLSDAR